MTDPNQPPARPRVITGHEINPANEMLGIYADDRNEQNGNASHKYDVVHKEHGQIMGSIHFQDGPIKEVGVNGVTQEVLLAILIDRLKCFQSSKYACRENAIALTKLEEAQHWLLHRTRAREARGVEGTHEV